MISSNVVGLANHLNDTVSRLERLENFMFDFNITAGRNVYIDRTGHQYSIRAVGEGGSGGTVEGTEYSMLVCVNGSAQSKTFYIK